MIAALLLLASVGALLRFARNDIEVFERFKAIEESAGRQRAFLHWTAQGLGLFAALPLAGLALLGRLDTIVHFPAAFAPWRPDLHDVDADFLGSFGAGVIGAMLAGGVIGGLIAARRKRPVRLPGLDIDAMMPRNAAETGCVALLATQAAIGEELCFRLYLPLLLAELSVPVWIGLIASTLLFGLLHRYQGPLGIALTMLLGGAFGLLYLGGGGLALPIAVHLLINLNSLVLRPTIQRRFARKN